MTTKTELNEALSTKGLILHSKKKLALTVKAETIASVNKDAVIAEQAARIEQLVAENAAFTKRLKIEVSFINDALNEASEVRSLPPLITGVYGKVLIHQLVEIENELNDEWAHEKEGVYTFFADYFAGQYGEYDYCEIAPGWELDLEKFEPFYRSDGVNHD